MNEKDIQEYLEEGLSEEGTVEKAFDYLLENEIRDLFEMDDWDQPEFTSLEIPFNGEIYIVDIRSNGCCEVTNNHRILYWEWDVTKK